MAKSNISFSAVVHALSQAEVYPHHPARVEVRQTHISYVFIADPFVYKIKKPVRYSFIDYSTLDQRSHFCREEVRLNQRLAPNVYLGVVPILEHAGKVAIPEGAAIRETERVVEYAVKMQRLPEHRMLDHLVHAGQVAKPELKRLATVLVDFHRDAATERAPLYGSPDAVWQRWADNFRETESFLGREINPQDYRRIRDFTERFFRDHKSLLKARVREGRVREGHGDLRAEHVCVTDGIVVFDCIEFNEGFRYCDVSSELAFLSMDLDYLGTGALSQQLVESYASISRDRALSLLLPFYQCYRAYVRGKVECLKSQEEEVPEPERRKAAGQARRHFSLAYRYARGTPAAAMIIVCGLTATGKSTFGQIIRDRTGFALLSSDITRKRLAGLDPIGEAGAGFREGVYNQAFTDLTYKTMLKVAEEYLTQQKGVILDATFKDARHRRLFLELAARLGAPLIFVECRADEKEILRRLEQRSREAGHVSDATQEVYLRLRDEFMPLAEISPKRHIIALTDSDPNDAINQLDAFLYRPA